MVEPAIEGHVEFVDRFILQRIGFELDKGGIPDDENLSFADVGIFNNLLNAHQFMD